LTNSFSFLTGLLTELTAGVLAELAGFLVAVVLAVVLVPVAGFFVGVVELVFPEVVVVERVGVPRLAAVVAVVFVGVAAPVREVLVEAPRLDPEPEAVVLVGVLVAGVAVFGVAGLGSKEFCEVDLVGVFVVVLDLLAVVDFGAGVSLLFAGVVGVAAGVLALLAGG
jgi:hypothetical protein